MRWEETLGEKKISVRGRSQELWFRQIKFELPISVHVEMSGRYLDLYTWNSEKISGERLKFESHQCIEKYFLIFFTTWHIKKIYYFAHIEVNEETVYD